MTNINNMYDKDLWELNIRAYTLSQELREFIDCSEIQLIVTPYIDKDDGSSIIRIHFSINYNFGIYLPDLVITELTMFGTEEIYYYCCMLPGEDAVTRKELIIRIAKWILEKI